MQRGGRQMTPARRARRHTRPCFVSPRPAGGRSRRTCTASRDTVSNISVAHCRCSPSGSSHNETPSHALQHGAEKRAELPAQRWEHAYELAAEHARRPDTHGGQGKSLVPPRKHGSVTLLLRGPGRTPGDSLYTQSHLSLGGQGERMVPPCYTRGSVSLYLSHAEASLAQGQGRKCGASLCTRRRLALRNGGQGGNRVFSYTRGRVSLSRGPGRTPGASVYTRSCFSFSI